MPVADDLLDRLAGALAERYEGLEFLARGGMGVVFRAWDRRLGRWVALKTLAPDQAASPGVHERWRREVRAMAAVRHPNVITLFDADRAAGVPYFTMEYLEGLSLRQLGAQGRLRPDALVAVVADVASGLSAIHAAGMLHRDIKPENVVLCRDGRAVLMDLGLMTSLDRHQTALTATGHVVGTYVYLAPEVLAGGTATPASDVYQLALTLYEGLAGRLPFDAAGLLNWAHGRGSARIPPPEAPGVDGELATVVLSGLARRPENRCAAAEQLERNLRGWHAARRSPSPSSAADVLVDAPRVANPRAPVEPVEAASPPMRRAHVAAASAGLVLGTLTALLLLWSPRVPSPDGARSAPSGRIVSEEEVPGWTPLHLAAGSGQDERVADLLAQGASATAVTEPEGRTPIHLAACGGTPSVVVRLLGSGASVDARDGRGRTPLHLAALHGRAPVLGLLLAAGADPNAADDDGAAPLHMAAALGQVGVVVELLRGGAWLEARTRSGCTPLLGAARTGNTVAALVLLDEGARPDAVDVDGLTALHAAMPQGNLTLVESLLARGGDPALADRWGRSSLDLARSFGAEDAVALARLRRASGGPRSSGGPPDARSGGQGRDGTVPPPPRPGR